jgi:hypothetical protein
MGIYHCGHPDDTDVSSYWWRRYSSLACMPTPEIVWALPCSACGEHLANLLCQRRWRTYAMSRERTSILPVAPLRIVYVALCLMSSFSFHKHAYWFERKCLLLRQVSDVLLPDHRLCTCVTSGIQLRLMRELLSLHLIILMSLHMAILPAEGQFSAIHKNHF